MTPNSKLSKKQTALLKLSTLIGCFLLLAFTSNFAQQISLSGSIEASDSFDGDGALNPDQAVSCIVLVVPEDIVAGSGLFLDFDTDGSTDVIGGGGADTEFLLFNGTLASGASFLFSDDDDGAGLTSALSFGDGAGPGVHTADIFSGENGTLPAGTYTIVIGEFSTNDPAPGSSLNDFLFVNGDNGDEAVNWMFQLFTNVPGVTAEIVDHLMLMCPDLTMAFPMIGITSESSCQADGTVSGGVLMLPPVTDCPTGSSLQFSVDGGPFTATAPMYNQTMATAYSVRCTCDSDDTIFGLASTATTTPMLCPEDPCEANVGTFSSSGSSGNN